MIQLGHQTIDKAIIVTIGDELLIGQTIDTNSAWMGQKLTALGVEIVEKIAIPDTALAITSTLARIDGQADLVLITGGLGPTKDDITKKTMADYFGLETAFHQPTYDHIKAFFDQLGRPMREAHRIQSFMPVGIELLRNSKGTAPGMVFRSAKSTYVSMPGVPYEMKAIMEEEIISAVATANTKNLEQITLHTVGMGETDIAERIAELTGKMEDDVHLAYLPSLGQVRLRVTIAGPKSQQSALEQRVKRYAEEIANILGTHVYGYDGADLAAVVGAICLDKGLTIGTCESCTGGSVASSIVANPGASTYFLGSIVSYTNELKGKILGVEEIIFKQHGAVSEACVRAMVAGGIEVLGVDVVVSISGIAGPDGGTPEKPVGMIWMAVGDRNQTVVKRIQGSKDRAKNITFATNIALGMLRSFLLDR